MFTQERETDENNPLLGSSRTQAGYGSVPGPSTDDTPENSGLRNFISQFQKIFPYIWPYGDRHLQFLIFVCFCLMVLGLVINVFTPVQIGLVVDQLNDGAGKFAWAAVSLYVGFRFLQGGVSLIIETKQNKIKKDGIIGTDHIFFFYVVWVDSSMSKLDLDPRPTTHHKGNLYQDV
jgi:ATP-binding cassette subfamily B (MDR/TAP) protein 6